MSSMPACAELVHRLHHGAVLDVLVGLDEDDLLLLVLEDLVDLRRQLAFAHRLGVRGRSPCSARSRRPSGPASPACRRCWPPCGSLTSTPFCNSGATSIMMMSSTSMTSTSGVTLMSDLTPPLAPPTSIDIANSPDATVSRLEACGVELPSRSLGPHADLLRRLLDEVVDQLRRRVVHLDVEVLDAAGQVVVEPHRRDRDDQPERGLDERFRNTGRDGADTARAAGARCPGTR